MSLRLYEGPPLGPATRRLRAADDAVVAAFADRSALGVKRRAAEQAVADAEQALAVLLRADPTDKQVPAAQSKVAVARAEREDVEALAGVHQQALDLRVRDAERTREQAWTDHLPAIAAEVAGPARKAHTRALSACDDLHAALRERHVLERVLDAVAASQRQGAFRTADEFTPDRGDQDADALVGPIRGLSDPVAAAGLAP